MLLLFVLLTPALSIPYVVLSIYHKNKKAIIYLLLIILGLSCYIPPIADQNRYFWIINSDYTWNELYLYIKEEFWNLNLVTAMCLLFSKLHLTLELARMVVVAFAYMVGYQLFLSITKDTNNETTSNDEYFVSFLLVILSIPFQSLFYNFRWGLACYLCCTGFFYLIYLGNKKLSATYLLLSALVHYGIIPLLIVSLFTIQTRKRFGNLATYTFLAVLFLVFTIVLYNSNIANFFNENYQSKYEEYVGGGYWSGEFQSDQSFRYKILFFLKCYFRVGILSWIVFSNRKTNPLFLIPLFSAMVFFLLFNKSVFGIRHYTFLLAALSICVAYGLINKQIPLFQAKICIAALIIFQFFTFYEYRNLKDYDREISFFYYALPQSYLNHYDISYHYTMLTWDGNAFIKNE